MSLGYGRYQHSRFAALALAAALLAAAWASAGCHAAGPGEVGTEAGGNGTAAGGTGPGPSQAGTAPGGTGTAPEGTGPAPEGVVTCGVHQDLGGDDWGQAIIPGEGGGYVICGETRPKYAEYMGAYIAALDSSGKPLWVAKTKKRYEDYLYALCQTSDGAYVAVGQSQEKAPTDFVDAIVVKVDPNGNLLWRRELGSTDWDAFYDVVPTADGGALAVGYSRPAHGEVMRACLVRLNASGETVWTKLYPAEADEAGASLAELGDGGYLIWGDRSPAGECFLLRVDSQGEIVWKKSFPVGPRPRAGALVAGEDGSAVMGAWAGDGKTVRILAVDVAGACRWTADLDGVYITRGAHFLAATGQGTYVVAGYVEPDPSTNDMTVWLAELDNSGKLLWRKTYPGDNRPGQVSLSDDGGFIVVGTSGTLGNDDLWTDVWLLKTDEDGEVKPLVE